MPWGDGTGPMGRGPMTGRGAGFCAGYNVPGYANPVSAWGPYNYPARAGQPLTPEEEVEMLREAEADIDARITEIEKILKSEKK